MLEIADIFRGYGSQYREKFGQRMPSNHLRAMLDIERCRTEILGGLVYYCEHCAETHYSYHSCQNRHCPKCQNERAEQWLEQQRDLLLPVDYFMVTFTLPAELREVARSHQTEVYNILFRTSAAALQELALDPRFVGGQLGMVGLLHTWGRDLSYHPHVHYLVPGVGPPISPARPPSFSPAPASPVRWSAAAVPAPCRSIWRLGCSPNFRPAHTSSWTPTMPAT